MISINERAFKVVNEMIYRADELNVKVLKAPCKATVIDCGVAVKGSIEAGLYVARITAGDLINFSLSTIDYGGFSLPVLNASSDYPVIATIGGQLGDWEIKYGDYFAIGSGPARALALNRSIPTAVGLKREELRKKGLITYTPREIYEKIGYRDKYDKAVIVIESSSIPPDEVLQSIARSCDVEPDNLYALITPTSSLAGSVQIAGRIVEVGIHKLSLLGFDFTRIFFGSGSAPIAPIHPDPSIAMGRTNDAIRYGGTTYYIVDYEDDEELREYIIKVPPTDNKSFTEIFKESPGGFYDVDLRAFAPAVISMTNSKTGRTFSAGCIKPDMLKKTLGIE
ncbi:MAG: methenyltetrahydromethanopterin cyclohydrolase [Desulfurococcaceae archaeon]